MAKPEMELQSVEHIPWQQVAPGTYEKILSMDPETGHVSRLIKQEPGSGTSETSSHDFWEEVWIFKGSLIDRGKNLVFAGGMYACRPPGMKHGPYSCTEEALILEIKYSTP